MSNVIVVAVESILLAIVGFIVGYKVRERRIEKKRYPRRLKLEDA